MWENWDDLWRKGNPISLTAPISFPLALNLFFPLPMVEFFLQPVNMHMYSCYILERFEEVNSAFLFFIFFYKCVFIFVRKPPITIRYVLGAI